MHRGFRVIVRMMARCHGSSLSARSLIAMHRQEDLAMRQFPGWVVGALSTAAIVGAFYAGGAISASDRAPLEVAEAPSSTLAPADNRGLEVACEPGQRAVVRQALRVGAGSVACVSVVTEPAYAAAGTAGAPLAGLTRVAYMPEAGYAQPAVINEPIEVYRPRSVPVSSQSRQSREVARPARSVKKSVAIIAGSTAVGATIGGLTKGKKGALIGGIVGGGAATVWDQVTRRRDSDQR